jgi:hypothetical protein
VRGFTVISYLVVVFFNTAGLLQSQVTEKARLSESPDKKWSVQIADDGVRVADTSGLKNPVSVPVLTPVLEITWLQDSSGFVVVEHIAHGSQLALISRDAGGWKRAEVAPVEESVVYSVVSYKIGKALIEVEYKVTPRSANGKYGQGWRTRISFDSKKRCFIK